MSFNIYCLCKNGELIEQAKVEETTDNYTINLNPLPSVIFHMDSYLEELFNLMMKYERENMYQTADDKIYKTKRYEYIHGEFVEATIFHRVLMRKGSYFYVIQKSDRGTRFLLYAVDRIHHSSNALGFSMRIPNVVEELNDMKKILSEKNVDLTPDIIGSDSFYFL
jgi:hypothetical protein